MNHAVTVGDLFLAFAVLVGLCAGAFGAIAIFASGMSTNPEASREAYRSGCQTSLAGVALIAVGIWGLLA